MQNSFDKDAQNFDAHAKNQAQTAKVLGIFADKSFSQRYNLADKAAKMLAFICNIISLSTFAFLVGYMLYNLCLPALGEGSLYVAIPFAVAISGFFELVKNAAYANFLIGFYKFKNAAISGLAALAILSGISIGSSFVGAKMLPAATLVDTTKHDFSSFDAQKVELNNQIKAAQVGSTYKGILTKQGHAQISKIQKELDNLAKEREKYTELIDTEKAVFAQEKTSITQYLGYFAIIAELVYIACYSFSFYYLYRYYVELQISGTTNPESVPAKFHAIHTKENAARQITPNTQPTSAPNLSQPANPESQPAPRKIGFILGENVGTTQTANPERVPAANPESVPAEPESEPNRTANPESEPAANPESEPEQIVSKYGVGVCECCGSKFHKNSYNHKFCTDICKLDFHEKKHGARFVPRKK